MPNSSDTYSYVIQTSATGTAETVANVQRVSKATRQAADDAKAAAREQAKAAREAARAQAQAAKEQERAAREAAREQARQAKEAAREQAREAIRAAREQERAAKQAARIQAAEARKAAREQADAARQAARGQAQAAKQAEAAAREAADRIAKAGQRVGQGLGQVTFIFDDLAYGASALRNQILPLSTAMLGFGPAGAIVGAAGTILVGVFGETIDKALAAAGVLDENLVKSMDRAGQKAVQFRKQLEGLNEAFATSPKPTKEMASSVAQIFDDAGKATTDGIIKLLDAANSPQAEAAYERSRQSILDKLRDLSDRGDAILARGGDPTHLAGATAVTIKQLEELDAANARRIEESRKRLEDLQKAAIGGDDDAINRLRGLLDQVGGEQNRQASAALWRLTEAGKAWYAQDRTNQELARQAIENTKERTRYEEKLRREAEELEQENRRNAEAYFERAKAAEEAARREIAALDAVRERREAEERDEETQRVLDALGGRFDQGIAAALGSRVRAGQGLGQVGVGGATDAIAGQVVQRLVRANVPVGTANDVARQLVEEQAAGIRQIVDSNNLNFALMQQMLAGQGQLAQIQEQQRAELLQMMQIAEMHRRRLQANSARLRPLRMMQGNNLRGGW